MSRDEIVLLVSRALAVMWAVAALLDVTYVPEFLISAHHYATPAGVSSLGTSYLEMIHRIYVGALLIRIVVLSIATWLFWQCGPWVAGLLLPARDIRPGGEG